MTNIKIYSDGGSRGNPGPAGVGFVISDEKSKLFEGSLFIGEGTNNFAEYTAVIKALEWCKENIENSAMIDFYLDSQLVVEQLNQRYKLKNEGLKPLFWQVRELVMFFGGNVSFQYIPREQNKEADALVNLVLDNHMEKK